MAAQAETAQKQNQTNNASRGGRKSAKDLSPAERRQNYADKANSTLSTLGNLAKRVETMERSGTYEPSEKQREVFVQALETLTERMLRAARGEAATAVEVPTE